MTRANAWTHAEEAWLRECYPTMRMDELVESHDALFGTPRTPKAISSRAKVLGLLKVDGYQRNPPILWTPERVAWFRSYVPGHSETEISAEHERIYGFPLRSSQIGNAKTRFGVTSGTHGGRFEPGHDTWNKGRSWDEYLPLDSQERCRATQFKPGELQGSAKLRHKPVGFERVNKNGYIEIKVHDGLQDKPNDNFVLKHRLVYEQAHGEVPPGCNVVFADHDKRNFDPDNLVAVPRHLWSIIVHRQLEYHDAESLRVCMAIAELDKARFAAELRPRECKRCGAVFQPRYAHQRTCDGCLGRE